jgi:hypothetical protein
MNSEEAMTLLAIGALSFLGLLGIAGYSIFRAGVRRGVRKTLTDARRAFELGVAVGRREERFQQRKEPLMGSEQ